MRRPHLLQQPVVRQQATRAVLAEAIAALEELAREHAAHQRVGDASRVGGPAAHVGPQRERQRDATVDHEEYAPAHRPATAVRLLRLAEIGVLHAREALDHGHVPAQRAAEGDQQPRVDQHGHREHEARVVEQHAEEQHAQHHQRNAQHRPQLAAALSAQSQRDAGDEHQHDQQPRVARAGVRERPPHGQRVRHRQHHVQDGQDDAQHRATTARR